MQDQNRFKVEYLPDGKPSFFKGGGGSAMFYYFVIDQTGERWLAKGLFKGTSFYDEDMEFDRAGVLSNIYKELLANRLYACFGVPVARLTTADLPACFRDDQYVPCRAACERLGITHLPAVISRFLDHFNSYDYLPQASHFLTQKPYFELLIKDQYFPEAGLGKVLAVAQWIADFDVIGGAGRNVGYRLREYLYESKENHTLNKGLMVETCKIDPGEAFYGFDNEQSNEVNPNIQLALQGYIDKIYTKWQNWPENTQAEYWVTIKAIIALSPEKLRALFEMTDPNKYFQDYEICIQRLIMRQTSLSQLYRDYEQNILIKPQKDSLLDLTLFPSPDEPLERLSIQRELMLSNRLVQQAFYFYLPPFVLMDDSFSIELRQTWQDQLVQFTEDSDKRVLLLIGPAGSGKTVESLRCLTLTKALSYIPLRIELKRFTEKTVRQCVRNTLLDDYQLTPQKIESLKGLPFLFILDGYDEVIGNPDINLYDSNDLYDWPYSKILITCRNQYYSHDKRKDFIPHRYPKGLEVWHLAPLNFEQIEIYIRKQNPETFDITGCLEYLKNCPEVQAVINTPMMLRVLVDAWPALSQKADSHLTRYRLYEAFFTAWGLREEVRACQKLGKYEKLTNEASFNSFLDQIAWMRYSHQQIMNDSQEFDASWNEFFQDNDEWVRKLRTVCPLIRQEEDYHFVHESFADYFVAHKLWESLTESAFEVCLALWNTQFLVDNRPVLEFLTEQLKTLPKVSDQSTRLFELINASRSCPENGIAASNAISLLNHAEFTFIRSNFEDIHIPKADLSYSCCVEANFTGAGLENVNFSGADLRGGQFKNSNMTNIVLGEGNASLFRDNIESIAYSWDGRWRALAIGSVIVLQYVKTSKVIGICEGHKSRVTSVACSPDRQHIVSGSVDGTICVWNIVTGNLEYILFGHTAVVWCVTYSPDGVYIASGGFDKTIRIWEAKTGQLKYTLEETAFSQENTFYSLENSLGVVYESTGLNFTESTVIAMRSEKMGGKQQLFIKNKHSKMIYTIMYSPNDAILPETYGWVNASDSTHSLAYSPDGRFLVSGGLSGRVRIWNMHTGKLQYVIKVSESTQVQSVAYSPDGKYIAAGSDDYLIYVWHAQTGILFHTLEGHKEIVRSLSFSPDSLHIASGSFDHTVRIWNIQTGTLKRVFKGHTDYVNSVVYSPDGKYLTSASYDFTVRVWEAQAVSALSLLHRYGHENTVNSVSYSPDGMKFVSGSEDKTVRVWDSQTGKLMHTFTGHTGSVAVVVYSPDGKYAASGSHDKTIRVWNLETGCLERTLEGHRQAIYSIAYSQKGTHLISAGDDEAIYVWEIETGAIQHILKSSQSGSISRAVYSYDETFIFSNSSNNAQYKILIWDAKSGELKNVFEAQAHKDAITSFATSPDGKHIASGSRDKTIQVRDAQTGELHATLTGHKGSVYSIAYSPEGSHIISGSHDKTVRVWRVQTEECLQVIKCTFKVQSIIFHPMQTHFLIAAGNAIQSYTFNINGYCQLIASIPPSEVLQLGDCSIEGALGLSPSNKIIFENAHKINDHYFFDGYREFRLIKSFPPGGINHIYLTHLVSISNLAKKTIPALSEKIGKLLNDTTGQLLIQLANIAYNSSQMTTCFYPGEEGTVWCEFTLMLNNSKSWLAYYKKYFTSLIITHEQINDHGLKVLFNSSVLINQVLPKLVEFYFAKQSKKYADIYKLLNSLKPSPKELADSNNHVPKNEFKIQNTDPENKADDLLIHNKKLSYAIQQTFMAPPVSENAFFSKIIKFISNALKLSINDSLLPKITAEWLLKLAGISPHSQSNAKFYPYKNEQIIFEIMLTSDEGLKLKSFYAEYFPALIQWAELIDNNCFRLIVDGDALINQVLVKIEDLMATGFKM